MRLAGSLRRELELLLDEPLEPEAKGVPPSPAITLRELGTRDWNVLDGDLILPVMVLKEDALAHNLELMARWCAERGLDLAPHGKTTMAPQLFARQLQAGAWGMTAATIGQVRVMRAFGVPRVLMANELVQPAALRWLARELEADPGFDFLCLVDGLAGVARMEAALEAADADRPCPCSWSSAPPGRGPAPATARRPGSSRAPCGARPCSSWPGWRATRACSPATAPPRRSSACAATSSRSRRSPGPSTARGFGNRDEVVVSAGGSAFFDEVAGVLGGLALSRRTRVVLRSGCYLTHDHGHYRRLSPLAGGLRPALELWAEVVSRPEPGLAVLCLGKRDAPYDLELPIPVALRRYGGGLEPLPSGALDVRQLDDQHAYVATGRAALDVGDLVGLGISHPCTAFDKWRVIPTVDSRYGVTGGIRTFF